MTTEGPQKRRRFVRICEIDSRSSPGARFRLEHDPAWGTNAVLSDETVLPEQLGNADARHVDTIASIELTAEHVRWLARALAELVARLDEQDLLQTMGRP